MDMNSPGLMVKLFRRTLRRVRAHFRYGSLTGSPIFFANSFPKSGTHLLTQVLQGFPNLGAVVDSGLPAIVTFDGPTGEPRPLASILQDLHRLRDGDIAYGHLHAVPEIVAELTRKGVVPYFIFRDPRDVAVSHVHYVTEMDADHVHHRYYAQGLATFDERLQVSILGIPDLEIPFPDIRKRFEPYLGWIERPEVLAIRFEDFIQERGETLGRIFDSAEARGFQGNIPRDKALQILEAGIIPEKSPTFRSGKTGKWRDAFSEKHKSIFKEVTGDLLIQLGYETHQDW
jgi:hypothetical protein